MIYFDNAATTYIKPECVSRAVTEAMHSFGNSGRGAYEGSLDASRKIYECREAINSLFGGWRADHVVFTANATEALNIALFGLIGPGDRVISSVSEHNSVLRPLYALEERGAETEFLPVDGNGRIRTELLPGLLERSAKAVVLQHASNLTGNTVCLSEIGALCRRKGALFIVDASQSAGTLPINMQEMNIDVLAFTGHKGLMGPQGTGGLCIRPGVDIRPLLFGGTGIRSFLKDQPERLPARLEAGTLNGHGIAGLAAAVEFIRETGIDAIHSHEDGLARVFTEQIREIPGVSIYGDFEAPERTATVSLSIEGISSDEAAMQLSQGYGICVRAGAHCAPRLHESLGTSQTGLVRFSFGYFNTEEEVLTAVQAVREIAENAGR